MAFAVVVLYLLCISNQEIQVRMFRSKSHDNVDETDDIFQHLPGAVIQPRIVRAPLYATLPKNDKLAADYLKASPPLKAIPRIPTGMHIRIPADVQISYYKTQHEPLVRHIAPLQRAGTVRQIPARSGVEIGALNKFWTDMLLGGQIFVATILMTKYAEKYEGQHMDVGSLVDVRMPYGGVGHVRQFELKFKVPEDASKEVTPYVWVGGADDPTIYVCFSMQHSSFQQVKNLHEGLIESEWVFTDKTITLYMSSYIERLLDGIWTEYTFGTVVLELSRAYPEHKVLFAGLSHGGTLAQAGALRYVLDQNPSTRPAIYSMGAYRWCDESTSRIMEELIGNYMLPMAAYTETPVKKWDSVVGYPSWLAPMPRTRLLDVDRYIIREVDGAVDYMGNTCPNGPSEVWSPTLLLKRMFDLHFADTLIGAIKGVYNKLVQDRILRE